MRILILFILMLILVSLAKRMIEEIHEYTWNQERHPVFMLVYTIAVFMIGFLVGTGPEIIRMIS